MGQLLNINLERIGRLLVVVVYPSVWLGLLILAVNFLPREIIDDDKFIIFYTIIFLSVLITRSTTWSIGHDQFGIKGDSRSRVLNYHHNENGTDFWFDLYADSPELLKDKDFHQLTKYLVDKKT